MAPLSSVSKVPLLYLISTLVTVKMTELVEKLTTKISSDEEVLTLQQLLSLLAAENNASQSDLELSGLEDGEACIELFGKKIKAKCW